MNSLDYEKLSHDINFVHLVGQFQYFCAIFVVVICCLLILRVIYCEIKGRPYKYGLYINVGLLATSCVAFGFYLTALSLPCMCDFQTSPSGCASVCTIDPYTLDYFYKHFNISPDLYNL